MIWNFVMPAGFFHPGMFTSTNTQLPYPSEPQKEAQKCPKNAQSLLEQGSQVLDLTEQDLLEAGYNTGKKAWSEEEDKLLKELRDKKRLEWSQIAELIPDRNSKMCYSRYRRLENQCKELWRRSDDDLILKLVQEHGQNWKIISQHFQRRTSKQVKQHYLNYLRAHIKKDQWSLDEDLKLIDCLRVHGKNWKQIENHFEGRTQNQIKNRYFGRLKRLAIKKSNAKEGTAKKDKIS